MAKFQIAHDKFDPDFIERRRQGLEVGLFSYYWYVLYVFPLPNILDIGGSKNK